MFIDRMIPLPRTKIARPQGAGFGIAANVAKFGVPPPQASVNPLVGNWHAF
jgi:hypothetical protein